MVGTGKKAYLQRPHSPAPSLIPLLDRDRCRGGVGFSPEPQLTPGEEALTSLSRAEREELETGSFSALFVQLSLRFSLGDPWRRHRALCSAGRFSSKSLPLGAQGFIAGQGEGGAELPNSGDPNRLCRISKRPRYPCYRALSSLGKHRPQRAHPVRPLSLACQWSGVGGEGIDFHNRVYELMGCGPDSTY